MDWRERGGREGEGLPPRATKGRDRGDETHSVIGRINELTSPAEQCTGLKSNATVERLRYARGSTACSCIREHSTIRSRET